MKQSRLILINILILVAVIIVGGLGVYYWNQNYNYVSTQDASVSAPTIPVPALAAGTIENLSLQTGQHVTKGQIVGQEIVAGTATGKGAAATTTINLVAPASGTIATVSTSNGQVVGAGTPLFTEVKLDQVTVVANIPETKIRNVSVGQTATIYVDAHPGVSFTGTVQAIQPTTQSFFSLIPTSATAGTYTKVTQRVPVILSINTAGYSLLPGENCEVRITIH
ncbi:MAG: secretion protein HlyD [Sulfobacillus benefaciens]|uniref:Secretion protein HlyD n=1 Tax=Sulfobacillus benefaciens TaxID=453960 RepID=A0A2T2XCD6_9FIRM|nr:MAG: secretion protein HlyD [Sulfobacillus benefaciens]